MDKEIERAKKLLESKGYKVSKFMLFEGLDESDVVSFNEFLDVHGNEYAWEYSLAESLSEIDEELEGDQMKEYEVGDIIMPAKLYSPSSHSEVEPHRVLLIQAKTVDNDDVIKYRGFLLSSKVQQSNKYGGYPNNIYIEDYASILHRGKRAHKEAFIRVDDIVEFTNKDLDTHGVWKGQASYSFFNFVNNCYNNYRSGKSNKYKYWHSQRRDNNG